MSALSDRRVVVTGGGSGIGLASARLLLAEGATVVITGRNETKLREAVASLHAPDRASFQAADLSDPTQAQRLVDAVSQRVGPIDILVNNAGVNVKERMLNELTPESWRNLVAGNLESAYFCMAAVLPGMRQRKRGLIINVNSLSGKRAYPLGGAAYIAAKFGLRGLAMAAAEEERPNGIRVCSIYPGEVNTPLLEVRPKVVSEERKQAMLQPDDVARAVLFLATLPSHVTVPELVITPANASYI